MKNIFIGLALLLTLIGSPTKADDCVLHEVTVEVGLPYYNFCHNDEEYVIHLELEADSTDKAYEIILSKVILRNGDYIPGTSLTAAIASDVYVERMGGVLAVATDIFLKRVNDYLATTSNDDPVVFPTDGTDFQKWVFLLDRGFKYVDGQIVLVI